MSIKLLHLTLQDANTKNSTLKPDFCVCSYNEHIVTASPYYFLKQTFASLTCIWWSNKYNSR